MSRVARKLLASAAAILSLSTAFGAVPSLASAGVPGGDAATVGDHGDLELDLAADGSVLHEVSMQRIAPGLDLASFQRLEGSGWTTGDVLVADLAEPTLSMDILDSGHVTEPATLSEQLAGTGAVAAVNGDYFDMNATSAPVHTNVAGGEVITGTTSPAPAFTVADGVAAIEMLSAGGTVTLDGDAYDLSGVNQAAIRKDSIGVYNEHWGSYTLDRPAGVPAETAVATATVVDGVVTSVSDAAGSPAFPAGGQILLGRGVGAQTLRALTVGDTAQIVVTPSSDVDLAVSGAQQLVKDGAMGDFPDEPVAARTAVGISKDGSELYVVTIDGRAAAARGMTRVEIARLMIDLGAYSAINLDGGGSTTMAARPAGSSDPKIVNGPSDGYERKVANSLAFFSSADAVKLTDVVARPALTGDDAHNVVPGLHRTIEGVGLSDQLAGTDAHGKFTVTSPGSLPNGKDANAVISSKDKGGAVLEGRKSGPATATYKASGMTATTELTVLGALDHITASSSHVALPRQGDTASVSLTAHDGDGFTAPVETSDIAASIGDGFTIEPAGLDAFTITAATDSGSTIAQFEAAGTVVKVAVTVGLTTQPVTDLANGASWTFAQSRASGALSTVTGPEGQPALRLTHDFTTTTGTRGSYAIAPAPIQIPGQPQAISMLINGDGTGVWPRLQVRDGDGVAKQLDGPFVTWTGWKETTFTVPPGTPYPLSLERVRLMETSPAASYNGDVSFTDIAAVLAPDVEQTDPVETQDPVIITDGTVDDFTQRIAVMSDAQFVGRAPQSDLVAAARRTLREIVAEKPDLLVINGDLVDEGATIDFDLARRVLEEEIGETLPYIYVPGNHEIMGGSIGAFTAAFGPARQVRDLGATRVITLDSSAGSLRGGGLDQIGLLEAALEEASTAVSTSGVVVFFHHPTDDPLADNASQISDRLEAAAVDRLLAGFRASAHKSVAVVNSHVGVFHARSVNGVSGLINGNSGKNPASTSDDGGFTGWTLLGIEPSEGVVGETPQPKTERLEWMRAEVRARVDTLSLSAPGEVALGSTVPVSGTVVQDGGRRVPVSWPMSAKWSGDGVTIVGEAGDRASANQAQVVRLNPSTGELTAIAPGTAVLRLTVNGVTEEVTITVPKAAG